MNAVARYDIDGLDISYDIEGDIVSGSDEVLLKSEHNLIEGLDWESSGYTQSHLSHIKTLSQNLKRNSPNP